MTSIRTRVFVSGVAALLIGICAETAISGTKAQPKTPVDLAVEKGLQWLVSVQGKDGGWGQDGGETTYVRPGEHLESTGNDLANTAVAAQALVRAGSTPAHGEYRDAVQRALRFIMDRVEQSPQEGLAITDLKGTQIQRKLGPYIDTFLTSKLLAELDGNMGDAAANARVRKSLEKCVAKIEKNQLKDGSWNIAGGWAPILGTSLASQSLYVANGKGVHVDGQAMDRIEFYSKVQPQSAGIGSGTGGVMVTGSHPAPTFSGPTMAGTPAAGRTAEVAAVSAGVSLYKSAQELEQLSRTDKDRKENEKQISQIKLQLSDPRFVAGFGSVGGEEFFSYLNISDSLHRAGGPEWEKWNADMTAKILKMQNEDGTWAGHHCITGRVAVTSAAILMLLEDREPPVLVTSGKTPALKKPVSKAR